MKPRLVLAEQRNLQRRPYPFWEYGLFLFASIYKFLWLENLKLSRAGSFWVNGSIIVFETRFARASQKQGKAAVS